MKKEIVILNYQKVTLIKKKNLWGVASYQKKAFKKAKKRLLWGEKALIFFDQKIRFQLALCWATGKQLFSSVAQK